MKPTPLASPRPPLVTRVILLAAALGAAATLGAGATPAAAQQVRVQPRTVWVQRGTPAWLGVSYQVRWVQADGACQPQVVVESLVHGAPAERAGLRPGDVIVALDGEPVPAARLQHLALELAPGDSVHLRFRRGTDVREVVAVADRRPDRPPAILLQPRTGGFASSTVPIIQLAGDTLVARNVETGSPWWTSGYWLTRADGRSEFRRLSTWPRDEMDQRVVALLTCADTLHWTTPSTAVARIDLRAFQARTDSLRIRFGQRALSRDGDRSREAILRELTRSSPRPGRTPSTVAPADPPRMLIYQLEEHAAVGFRGVAGAEMTPLEPELAEYFRGVREGLLVLRVAPETPAARAGLRPGDVVTEGGGRPLASVEELRALLSQPGPTPVELRLVRHGRERSVTIRGP